MNHASSARVVRFTLSQGDQDSIESFDLGKARYSDLEGLAIEKTKPFWVTHRLLQNASELSSHLDSQLLLLSDATTVTAILPVSTSVAAVSLRGSLDGSGHIWLRSERDSGTAGEAICAVGCGPRSQLLAIIDDCAAAATSIVDETPRCSQPTVPTKVDFSLFGNRKAVYCTWNSLGPDYTLSKVLDRLQNLKETGALEAYNAVLLDDGWQATTSDRTLSSFDTREGWLDVGIEDQLTEDDLAYREYRRKDSGVLVSRDSSEDSSKSSSSSLAIAIQIIKQRFPEIKAVGCWLTAQGYWNGLENSGPLSSSYKLVTLHRPKLEGYRWSHDAASIVLTHPDEVPRFWRGCFSSLRSAGVDFVKVDNQADVDAYEGEHAGMIRTSLLPSMREAALEAFGPGNLINCMPAGAREFSEYLSKAIDGTASMR